jgi:hypothetical protein
VLFSAKKEWYRVELRYSVHREKQYRKQGT